MPKNKLYVDSSLLTDKHISGVGQVALQTIRHLSRNKDFLEDYDIYLLVPFNKTKLIHRYAFNDSLKIKNIFLPAKILNGLVRFNLLPPMDIFLGKGIYLFPNFKNWPLLFSKSITYIHDIAFKVYPEFTEPRNRTMLNAQISRFLLRSDVIVTVSESSRQEILNHYTYLSKSKVRVVLNGVDTSVFYARNEAEVNKMRKKYALPARYFMFLSNLEPRKNILTLLDAYSRLPENVRFNSALFFVGGMGWLNEDVFKKIEQLELSGCNIIRPSIYVEDDDLPALLTGAVALVHPAFHEGFGMPPLEAIACETPVIISNIPSIREVIGEVGVYLKETTNSEALSQLMLNQYNKTYTKKQKQLLRERADNYRWGATLPELEKIIREV